MPTLVIGPAIAVQVDVVQFQIEIVVLGLVAGAVQVTAVEQLRPV